MRFDGLVVFVGLVGAAFAPALAESSGVPLLAADVAYDVREVLFNEAFGCLVPRRLTRAKLRAPFTRVGVGLAVWSDVRPVRLARWLLLSRVRLLARFVAAFLAQLAELLLVGDLILSHGLVDGSFANQRRDDALGQVVRANIVHDGLVKIDYALGKRKTDEVFVDLHSASGFLVLIADVLHVLEVGRVFLAGQLLGADHFLENGLSGRGGRF